MGCKAITPHLVGLASKLEDEPFHLIASHCQNQPKEQVVAYIRSQGLSEDTPNFTVTRQGRHPDVKGNGHVPYYAVFDHHGDLVHHHMCGAYHGGDGLKMIEWVENLLKEAPAIYLGREPFEAEAKLAKKVGAKKGLAGAVKEIEARREQAAGDSRSELDRLHAAVTRHRDDAMKRALSLQSSRPGEVMPRLKKLAKELAGTHLGAPVASKVAELDASADFKKNVALGKSHAKIKKSLGRLKPCKTCKRSGARTLVASCSGCRAASKGAIGKQLKKADKLAEQAGDLPIAAAIRDLVSRYR